MKTMRMVLLFLAVLCMVGKNGICAEAAETGKVHIFLDEEWQKTQRKGVVFSYTKVAEWSDGNFKMEEKFHDSKVSFNQIETAKQQEEAAEKLSAVSNEIDGSILTDENGEVVLENLGTGVYLFESKEITPFLVTIPMWDEERGGMMYEVKVFPKYIPILDEHENVETGDSDRRAEYEIGILFAVGVAILSLWKRK